MTVDEVDSSSEWSREQDKAFKNALATHPEDDSDRWEKIAADVPGKTIEEIKQHYELLVEDINQIESGCVPLPSYNSSSEGSTSHASDEGAGKKGSGPGHYSGESNHGTKASRSDQERRKGIAWTEDEHSSLEPGTEQSMTGKDLEIEGYTVGGLSIGGHETCVIFPTLKVAFDIGRCPPRAVSQNFLLITHAHMDHIGGLPMYVATRGLYRMKPPTIIVPISVKEDVEKLFEIHRKMDQSELKHNLIGLDIGEEFYLRKDLKVKAFRTYHVIPSQGYILYSEKQKLKPEYVGLSGNEIKNLKSSGVEITYTLTEPEIAFTGDTMSDFIVDENNTDVLRARILVLECTFVNNSITVEHARDYGHTHLSEIISYAESLQNRAILLIHFSARYTVEEIQHAVSALPPSLSGRTFALTEGF
ncbi:tRNase Z TRZ1 isoform X1 [Glycine soja]|uniref:TRNase Z TRZ1 isoform A n=1 Tax=Glycine soja TaxID=3848 RepID=A0A445EZD0_GLYSO|nr:tRNase Z TRZ1 isoform X1 [Glycine soja]XP_028222307.1 tRNase Z TRZ1 isoform X1 [Glycine soja]RZB41919.1 tRNase Z TRZ1 isoform A [Glycine soja]RZB41921.1 tRNase Z TRZ1 isoform C [Glycine soja]RZB41922.1 tRNase Z TRZ1 isoform D [Glycine soja]